MADMNGIAKAGHVREKLVQLIGYAETLRGLTQYAAMNAAATRAGIAVPDPLYVNMAKYHFAHGYHEAVRDVQDIAGGALVTGPGAEDLASAGDRAAITRGSTRAAGSSGRDRLKALSLVRDLVASEFGDLPGSAGGPRRGLARSREADGLLRSYDSRPALAFVRRMAGLTGSEPVPGTSPKAGA